MTSFDSSFRAHWSVGPSCGIGPGLQGVREKADGAWRTLADLLVTVKRNRLRQRAAPPVKT